MQVIVNALQGIWVTLLEMGPYLLLGFVVAVVLARAVTAATIRRHLGQGRVLPVLKATLFGVPLPLCSCGVIPVAASLKRHGANGGATISFMASTPQTGVDSILVTYSLLGWLFTLIRVIAAFASGLAAGLLTAVWGEPIKEDEEKSCNRCSGGGQERRTWSEALRHGLVTLPADLFRPLLLGLVVAGILTAVVPSGFVSPSMGHSLLGKVLMLGIGIPLYVCATASVPVAASFVALGFSPGAALIFLMSGPATNAATIALVWKDLGKRSCLIYLVTVGVIALAAGVILDFYGAQVPVLDHHHHGEGSGLKPVFAILLVALLVYARWIDPLFRKSS